MSGTPALRWLGTQAQGLHPLLRELHERGGVLRGNVDLTYGHGLAGMLGRRLARRLGLPEAAGEHAFEVHVHHDSEGMHWDRCFDGTHSMRSLFVPVGLWPGGYWEERTGPVQLRLTVDIVDGGWHWRVLGLRWHGLPLGLGGLRSKAYKRVEQGRYRFVVEFGLPLLGVVLGYAGLLDAQPAPP